MWVTEHNRVRSTVGTKPVTWNATLAAGAATHAQKCVMQHSAPSDRKLGGITLGENLAWGGPYDYYSDQKLFSGWENEKQFYTHPQGPSQGTGGETGHYTQIINKNVKEIGCACNKCGSSKFCVCRYNPIQTTGQAPY